MSQEAAFDYMADVTNFEEWDPGVSSSKLRDGEMPGKGTSYTVKASGAELVYKMLEYERPTRVVVEAKSSLLRSYDIIEVTPGPDGGSNVSYDATLELNGPLGLLNPIFGLFVKGIFDKAAGGLEKALDGVIVP
jgi:hypothetical protein